MPSNKDRYDLLTRDLTSPQSFKDFSFYFMISACLQRRVWMNGYNPNERGPLFPNTYTILCGPPGVGKGRALDPISDMLRYWRIDPLTGNITATGHDKEVETEEDKPYLFTCGPNNITYQDLLRKQASHIRYIDWRRARGETPRPPETPNKYGSSPIYFLLDELTSLFHRDAKNITDYLLEAFDCKDYEYSTIARGKDTLKKPSLSFIAGTTPDSLQEQMDEKRVGDGLSSRIIFVYELVEGKRAWECPPLDAEQRQAKQELLEYIKTLAFVYGRCDYSPEANAYMKQWWEVDAPNSRPNNSPKLNEYYTRKIIHVKKLSMILNFAESNSEYEISLETAKRAIGILDAAEKKMHYALNFKGRNPLGTLSSKVLAFMFEYRRPVNLEYILSSDGGGFFNELNEMEAKEVMRYLVGTGKIFVPQSGFYLPTGLKHILQGGGKTPAPIIKLNGETIGADLPALPLDDSITRGTENIA